MSDAEVARFAADGGARAALRRLRPRLPDEAPALKPPTRDFVEIPPPGGGAVDEGPEAFGRAVAGALQGDVSTPDGKRPFALAVYIPKDFGEPGAVVRIWTNGQVRRRADRRHPRRTDLGPAPARAPGQRTFRPGGSREDEALSAPVQVSDQPARAEAAAACSSVRWSRAGACLSAADHRPHHRFDDAAGASSRSAPTGCLGSRVGVYSPGERMMYGKLRCWKPAGGVGLCAIVTVWVGCAFERGVLRDEIVLGRSLVPP